MDIEVRTQVRAVLWLGRRNDIVQVLRGEPADERIRV
jgi:hypothetical protein